MAPKAIFAASKYAGALDAYIDYIKNMDRRGSRVGQGQPRQASIKLYVKPFALPLPATVLVVQSAAAPAWNTDFKQKMVGYTADVTGENDTELKLSDYKAPRVNYITGINANGAPETSKVTKLKYLKYGGKSRSAPFGKKNATDTVEVAFEALHTAILGRAAGTANTGQSQRLYLIPEKY